MKTCLWFILHRVHGYWTHWRQQYVWSKTKWQIIFYLKYFVFFRFQSWKRKSRDMRRVRWSNKLLWEMPRRTRLKSKEFFPFFYRSLCCCFLSISLFLSSPWILFLFLSYSWCSFCSFPSYFFLLLPPLLLHFLLLHLIPLLFLSCFSWLYYSSCSFSFCYSSSSPPSSFLLPSSVSCSPSSPSVPSLTSYSASFLSVQKRKILVCILSFYDDLFSHSLKVSMRNIMNERIAIKKDVVDIEAAQRDLLFKTYKKVTCGRARLQCNPSLQSRFNLRKTLRLQNGWYKFYFIYLFIFWLLEFAFYDTIKYCSPLENDSILVKTFLSRSQNSLFKALLYFLRCSPVSPRQRGVKPAIKP